MRKLSVTPAKVSNRNARRAAAMPLLAIAALTAVPAGRALATTLYYNAPGAGSFNIASNWSTDLAGTTPSSTVPGPGDVAVIGSTMITGASTVNLDAGQSVFTLQIGNGTTTTGVITVESDSVNNTSGGPNALTIGAGGLLHSNNTSGADIIRANVVLGASETWTNNVNLNVAGAITGTGNLTLVGNTTFSGTNGFNGNLVLASGTFNSNNAGLNPNGTGNITFSGNTTFGQNGGAINTAKNITFSSGSATNWYLNSSNATFTGAVTGPGAVTFIPNGATATTVTLGGLTSNTGLAVLEGTNLVLQLNKASSASVVAVGGTLTLNSTNDSVLLTGSGGNQIADSSTVALNVGTFDLYGHNETIGALTGAYSASNTALITNSQATASTLTFGGGNASGTFNRTIMDGVGSVGITKIGTGTEVLGSASSYTGATAIYGGTLTLDFTQTGAPTTNIAGATSSLILGGGTLQITGSTGANGQTFLATSIASGASALAVTSGTGGSNAVSIGTITRATGGTVNFTLPASGSIATTSTNGSGTILGGYAVVAGANWATVNGGVIASLGTYTTGFSSGADVEAGNATSAPAAMSINSLRFNTAGTAAVNTAGPLTIASGGILETSTVGANSVGISNNSITTGNGQDLIVNQYNTSGTMTINSAIVNAAAGSTGFTKSGGGAVVLGGTNTYTGATNINAGTVTVNNSSKLGNNTAVTLRGTSTLNFANAGGQLNLSSIGATATASSNTTQSASNAIDYTAGSPNINTRWETSSSDPGWIYVNLQSVYNLSTTQISWETADAKNFVLETATAPTGTPDGVSGDNGWTVVNTITNQASYNDKHYITYNLGASAQYVAMYGMVRATPYGYSIWDWDFFSAVSTISQSIGSLSSADTGTTVSLASNLTLTTGVDNTSTTFAGVISGAGTLNKAGSGRFALTNNNTYTGGTNVTAGTLAATGALGTGNVTVTGGTLELDSNSTIADTAGLVLANGVVVNLAFTSGTEIVGSLTINGVSIAANTVFGPNNYNGYDSYFTSSGGTLTVAPEPTSLGVVAGIGGLLTMRRRRRSAKPVA